LFVTPDRSNFADLSSEIIKQGVTINWVATGRQARETISETTVDLVLTDERLDDMSGLELIKQLVADKPMINCAAISSLSKEAYHEASEGLGILMQLPPSPDGADGERLMAHLNQILGLTKSDRRPVHSGLNIKLK
jgi:DNA-binding NtrC family response regulator